jgi:hypothetical protein
MKLSSSAQVRIDLLRPCVRHQGTAGVYQQVISSFIYINVLENPLHLPGLALFSKPPVTMST